LSLQNGNSFALALDIEDDEQVRDALDLLCTNWLAVFLFSLYLLVANNVDQLQTPDPRHAAH
jgi:hypothetical protein